MAGTMLALAVVEMQQAEARVVPGGLVLRLAGAAATPGRIVARPVVPGRVEPRPAEAAMVLVVVIVVQEKAAPTAAPVAVAAAQAPVAAYRAGAAMAPVAEAVQGTAGATVDLGAVEPIPAVPEVQATAGMDLAAARPGMTKVELVVATPAAVAPYLVEEVAGALCAR